MELTDSPLLVSLVGFFLFLPLLLFGLIGGFLTDQIDKRKLIIMSNLISLVAASLMMIQLIAGVEKFWHAYVTILFVGIGWSFEMPSRRAFVHDLLGSEGVVNGLALDSMAISTSFILGPSLGGVLITIAGVAGGYLAVVVFYAIAVVLAFNIASMSPVNRMAGGHGFVNVLNTFVEGCQYVWGKQALLGVVLVTILMNLLMFPYLNMVPVIARDVLGVGPGLMGTMQASMGCGAVFGAMGIAFLTNIRYHSRFYLFGAVIAFASLILFSFSRVYVLSILSLFVLGVGMAGSSTMQATIVVLVAKQDMRGKALGILSIAIGVAPFGALIIGSVADFAGPSIAVRLNATLGIILLMGVVFFMPSLLGTVISDESIEANRY